MRMVTMVMKMIVMIAVKGNGFNIPLYSQQLPANSCLFLLRPSGVRAGVDSDVLEMVQAWAIGGWRAQIGEGRRRPGA